MSYIGLRPKYGRLFIGKSERSPALRKRTVACYSKTR